MGTGGVLDDAEESEDEENPTLGVNLGDCVATVLAHSHTLSYILS